MVGLIIMGDYTGHVLMIFIYLFFHFHFRNLILGGGADYNGWLYGAWANRGSEAGRINSHNRPIIPELTTNLQISHTTICGFLPQLFVDFSYKYLQFMPNHTRINQLIADFPYNYMQISHRNICRFPIEIIANFP